MLALGLTVPWFFSQSDGVGSIAGFPSWAFYSLVATVLFGVLTFLCVGLFWDDSLGECAGEGDGEQHRR